MKPEDIQARDLDWLARYRAGDRQAAEQLLTAYKPLVLARIRPYFLPGADRDDLIQEGMLGLFQALERYDESRGSFAAFARLTVTRQILDAVKGATRKKQSPLNESTALDEQPDLADLTPNPEDAAIDRERLEAFQSFMQNKLSPYEQDVLRLFQTGHRYNEIAAQLGTNRKSVDNAMLRVRRKFREHVQRHDR